MEKNIVFLFDIDCDNRAAYAKAMSLAHANGADLLMLTSLSPADYDSKLDDVYFHILNLVGHYKEHYGDWGGASPVKSKQKILTGNPFQYLADLIKENSIHAIALLKESTKLQSFKNFNKMLPINKLELYLL